MLTRCITYVMILTAVAIPATWRQVGGPHIVSFGDASTDDAERAARDTSVTISGYELSFDGRAEAAGVRFDRIDVPESTSTVSWTLALDLPPMPVLVSPADWAWDVSTSASLEVAVSDPEEDELTVAFYGRQAALAPGPDFTLIVLPDTQHYTDDPDDYVYFTSQTQWIVDNRTALNIPYVAHLGDVVEHGDNYGDDTEWRVADAAMSLLEDPATTGLADGIPFGVAPGNHDQGDTGDGTSGQTILFNTFFGTARFQDRSYYGGHYGTTNDNNFELFSAGGSDYIVLHFEYNTSLPEELLDWADSLLKAYGDRRAIVVAHSVIYPGNPGAFTSEGRAIYNALRDNANLFLMLGGHNPGEGQRADVFDGHTVYSLLANYQSRTNGGDGWLRMMQFSPAMNVIHVRTYSPVLQQFETDADSEFTLSYDMQDVSFDLLATNTDVPSGSNTSITWAGLENGTRYDWYVTVDNGESVTKGPIWSFTTEGEVQLTFLPLVMHQ